jgi:hypothetical protein
MAAGLVDYAELRQHEPAGSFTAVTMPATTASTVSPVSTAVTARTRVMLVSVGLGWPAAHQCWHTALRVLARRPTFGAGADANTALRRTR